MGFNIFKQIPVFWRLKLLLIIFCANSQDYIFQLFTVSVRMYIIEIHVT